jgi:hypothetical protein
MVITCRSHVQNLLLMCHADMKVILKSLSSGLMLPSFLKLLCNLLQTTLYSVTLTDYWIFLTSHKSSTLYALDITNSNTYWTEVKFLWVNNIPLERSLNSSQTLNSETQSNMYIYKSSTVKTITVHILNFESVTSSLRFKCLFPQSKGQYWSEFKIWKKTNPSLGLSH